MHRHHQGVEALSQDQGAIFLLDTDLIHGENNQKDDDEALEDEEGYEGHVFALDEADKEQQEGGHDVVTGQDEAGEEDRFHEAFGASSDIWKCGRVRIRCLISIGGIHKIAREIAVKNGTGIERKPMSPFSMILLESAYVISVSCPYSCFALHLLKISSTPSNSSLKLFSKMLTVVMVKKVTKPIVK